MHPIRGFPAEPLGEIFIHCAEGYTDRPKRKPTPITLSHAFGMPKLWRVVDVDFISNPDPAKKVAFWAELSGNVPLDIFLHSIPRAAPPSLDRAMDSLLQAASRWKTLTISTSPPSGQGQATRVLRRPDVPTPLLTNFVLDASAYDEQILLNRFLPGSPALHMIISDNCFWRSIPRHFPALQHLQLFDSKIDWGIEPTLPQPGSFPKLTTLTLDWKACEGLADEQTPLAFPALEDLSFTGVYNREPMELLLVFLQYLPNPQLRRFSLDGSASDEADDLQYIEELKRCLARTSGIESIDLVDCDLDDSFLSLFSNPMGNDGGWLCPRLQKFSANSCGRISGDAIVKLVTVRGVASREKKPTRPLAMESVCIEYCQGVKSWHFRPILGLRKHRV